MSLALRVRQPGPQQQSGPQRAWPERLSGTSPASSGGMPTQRLEPPPAPSEQPRTARAHDDGVPHQHHGDGLGPYMRRLASFPLASSPEDDQAVEVCARRKPPRRHHAVHATMHRQVGEHADAGAMIPITGRRDVPRRRRGRRWARSHRGRSTPSRMCQVVEVEPLLADVTLESPSAAIAVDDVDVPSCRPPVRCGTAAVPLAWLPSCNPHPTRPPQFTGRIQSPRPPLASRSLR